jgi:D-sedoheptulose 7-phosphate isomerase
MASVTDGARWNLMDLKQRVSQQFNHSIATQQSAAAELVPVVVKASELITGALLQGNKVLCCGTAGSGGLAQYFASTLLNRYERERPGLPAIALNGDNQTLTAIANDFSYKEVFSKQLRVLAQEGDILLSITASSNSRASVEVIKAAQERGLNVVALTGHDGGGMTKLLNGMDIEIRVPAQSTARIQEVHLLVLHSLCDLIDIQIFGEDES